MSDTDRAVDAAHATDAVYATGVAITVSYRTGRNIQSFRQT
jgi:hypothetical protein